MSNLENDKLLLVAMLADDKTAIEDIYREHYNMVQQLIVQNGGSKDDAADVFQETIIVLYEKIKLGSFELSCLLKTYLYSIAKRIWIKKWQQQQKFTQQVDDFEEVVAVEDEMENHLKQQNDFVLMDAAMAKVGEPCKSILQAYYIQKKHMNTIAEEFGYTNADNAKTQKYKCLVRLKKLFFAQYKNTN